MSERLSAREAADLTERASGEAKGGEVAGCNVTAAQTQTHNRVSMVLKFTAFVFFVGAACLIEGPVTGAGSKMRNRRSMSGDFAQDTQTVCAGDTRGDRRCAHDATHRVCAKIGDEETSFFHFTKQPNWCGTRGHYGGEHGGNIRCPPENPTWCICKWALADWISGEGCGDSVEIDCSATDICATRQGLYFSYADYGRNLSGAQQCVSQKCSSIWNACEEAHGEEQEV